MERILREKLVNGKFGDVTSVRSNMMGAVKSKGNKTTEKKFCMALQSENINGWELHSKIVGNPDIYFPIYRLAIFLDGCFWHGCPKCGHIPKTNNAYWKTKIERNIERDFQKAEILKNSGYTVLRFWEHDLKDLDKCLTILKHLLDDILFKIIEEPL